MVLNSRSGLFNITRATKKRCVSGAVVTGASRRNTSFPLGSILLDNCSLRLFLHQFLWNQRFTSVLHLGERWHKRVISATAASKTFGLSSLRISNFLIPDPTLRQRFLSRLDAHGLDVFNALSVQAATTAWNESRQWLDSLLDYLAENRRWFVEQAAEHLPWARIVPAQGTYLLWMDCKKLGLDDEQLKWVMADVAGIAPSMGSGFGPAGSGFIRLNLGCPRTYLEMAIDGLKRISVKSIKGAPTGG